MTNNYLSTVIGLTLLLSGFACASAQKAIASCSSETRALLQVSAPETTAQRLSLESTAPMISTRAAAPSKAPEGDWKSLGEGEYFEDIMTLYSNVAKGTHWAVEIEQSETDPGWYRFLPYANPENTLSKLLGKTDTETYFYLNATNPSKVYMENATAFGRYQITNFVPENNWPASTYQRYGTLENGIISFVYGAFGLYTSYGWEVTNAEPGFKLCLPGAQVYDYSLTASAPFCAEDNELTVKLTCGKHIAKIKALTAEGYFDAVDENVLIAAQYGDESESLKKLTVKPEKNTIYTLIIAAFNADDEIVASAGIHYFGVYDESSSWKKMGICEFTDGIYSGAYEDIDSETLKIEISSHADKPNYFRVTDPYLYHSTLRDVSLFHLDHYHYIYINATRPDRAYIEASPVGVKTQFGEGAVFSLGGIYTGTQYEDELFNTGFYGYFDQEKGTITFGSNSLLLAESAYNDGEFMQVPGTTIFALPGYTGVEKVEIEYADDADVLFFNLQGQPVRRPSSGQMVIERRGSSARLIIAE